MLQENVVSEGSVITAAEFEAGYAAAVGTSVEQLHATGRAAEPCSCDWDQCRGWALGYRVGLCREDGAGFGGVAFDSGGAGVNQL